MDFLNRECIPVPRVLLNSKGKAISEIKINDVIWFYILMPFVEGKHLAPDQDDLIDESAKYQALMHKAAEKFKKAKRSNDFERSFNGFNIQNKKAGKLLEQEKGCQEIKK